MFSAAGKTAAAVSTAANYIEDVFSTWLYTGTGSAQTITNGIDLSTYGGLVWTKSRSAAIAHSFFDTLRGSTKRLNSATTAAEATDVNSLTSFNSSGFDLGSASVSNGSGNTYASWTFRKQPKFFDVVTYTGNNSTQTINHNLGSVPGVIIAKATSGTSQWSVYHRSLGKDKAVFLNLTDASGTYSNYWGTSNPTATTFGLTGNSYDNNQNGVTYVAYLFAHDAGGFGSAGADNVISCGSFTTDGSGNATVSLGYEPQWVLIKQTDGTDSWYLNDNMRGMAVSGNQPNLSPNLSAAEQAGGYNTYPNATGFTASVGIASKNYIYIAIRRGPMKTPTTGTSVYTGITRTGTAANATVTGTGFPVDLLLSGSRNAAFGTIDFDRLRGATQRLFTYSTAAEAARSTSLTSFAVQDGYTIGDDATDGGLNNSGQTYIYWNFRRAPGFFDVVCYTGTGSATTFNHNLGVAPELVIVKWRAGATGEDWAVMCTTASSSPDRRFLYLDLNAAGGGLNGIFADSSGTPVLPTATQVYIGTNGIVNTSAATYVAYLFASCPGVSKVGSYTGTGTTKQIDCGFTGGARFVLIKRTDSTGDWYVWDSARGIVSGNDPYLLLNSTAAEVTNTDYVDTYSAGFEISSTAPAAINANGGTFVFLAVA